MYAIIILSVAKITWQDGLGGSYDLHFDILLTMVSPMRLISARYSHTDSGGSDI